MSQLDLFGATSGCQQVVNKERDNEKENSPHTPLKGKETEKETTTTPPVSSPSETTLSGARACTRARDETGRGEDNSSVKNGKAAPARDARVMKAAYSMQETGKGLLVSADTIEDAHRFMCQILMFFRVPPPIVRLDLCQVVFLDQESYPSEWDRLMSGHVYLHGLGGEFVPNHYNREALTVVGFLRQYLRPGRIAAQHRLLISTKLSSARFARRYSKDILQLVLAHCNPVKLRTYKEVMP